MDYDYENWLAEMNVDEYPEYQIDEENLLTFDQN
jgi:hypothetical protein